VSARYRMLWRRLWCVDESWHELKKFGIMLVEVCGDANNRSRRKWIGGANGKMEECGGFRKV